MLFNSWEFVFFIIITFLLYYLPFFQRIQVLILILSSFLFYAFNKPVLLIVLLFIVVLFTVISYVVFYKTRKLFWVTIGVISSLTTLGFFKYSALMSRTLFPNDSISIFILMIPLPIGISFFIFEGISLIVDSYRYHTNKESKLIIPADFKAHMQKTCLFISFFPHLIAGPIVKAHQFLPQIKTKYLRDVDWQYVFKTLIIGYFLKNVIADNLKDQTFWMAHPYFQSRSSFTLLILIFGYSMQIFSDFAGYSMIALGTASLFGYTLPQNFNFPYISKSFSEFWQRWHISLSNWLKEYLYIPLGGNRKGKFLTYFNLLIVMFLGGLWHGASWSYAIWGLWHGMFLAIERLTKDLLPSKDTFLMNSLKMLFIFISVTISWLFFKLTEFNHVILYFKKIFENTSMQHNLSIIGSIIIYSIPVIIYHFSYLLKENTLYVNLFKKIEVSFYALLLLLIVMNSGTANEFIYFQF